VDQLLRATAKAESRHFWFRGFRAFMRPLVETAIQGRQDARILDCGCGTGANLEWLNHYGRSFGFDRSSVGLRLGRDADRRHLVRATVTAAPFAAGSFDLVTSFDVLYALEEPDAKAAIAEMFRLTRRGGFALINVAAMAALRGDHSVLGEEVRRYSRSDLERLVTGAGFTIVRLTYSNIALFFPLAGLRTMQRWRGLRAKPREISVPAAPINILLTGLLMLESRWLRHFDVPFGSSLICLARKPV
jgi:SAM-dependent methyltransferase